MNHRRSPSTLNIEVIFVKATTVRKSTVDLSKLSPGQMRLLDAMAKARGLPREQAFDLVVYDRIEHPLRDKVQR